jgi:hypothetical protein
MPTINDGNIPVNCFNVTIGSTAFVAESLNFRQGSQIVERRDADNAPSGQLITPDFVTGSITVQRPATGTALPAVGDVVALPSVALGGVTGSFYVSEIGPDYSQGAVHKFSVSIRKSV